MNQIIWTLCFVMALGLLGSMALNCGSSEEASGGTGGVVDDDDTADDDVPSLCQEGIDFVYGCGYYLVNDGYTQTQEQAYTECLALSAISDAWTCRLNCMQGSETCDMLYACMELCPTTPDT